MPVAKLAQLTVRNPSPIARRRDVIVSGVPLPRGVVTDVAALALRDARGRRQTCQSDVSARWADGSVKWALLTVPKVDVARDGSTRFALGTDSPRTTRGVVAVRRVAAGWRVTTDRLRFTVVGEGALIPVIESRVGGRWRRRAVGLDLAMTVERDGAPRRFLASRAPRTIEVEQRGLLRALLCVRGVHRADDGADFGPYTLRIEMIAGLPQLRLTHSFVYDGEPDRDFVRISEVVLTGLVGSRRQTFTFGGDGGREARFERRRASWAPDFRYAELNQDSVSHWRIRRWVDRKRSAVFCEEGTRADGWVELAGDRGRVAAAVREFWQNHPKALVADAATGELRIQLYPERAEPLNLSRYADHSYPWTYEHPAFQGKKPVPADPAGGAHGIRKTHDLMLLLDEPNPSAATLAFNEPLLLEWSPRWTKRTGVVAPAAPRVHKTWARRAGMFLDLLKEEMVRSGGTGYLDYFDLPHGFNVAERRWFHDFGGWAWINDEAMPCLGLWQTWLLTGRRDAFDLARAMGRHNGDVDSYMLGTWAGHGSRHNVNHWGDTCKEHRISQPIGKRFAYYVTGDRSVLDLNCVVLDSFLRQAGTARRFNMTADVPAFVASLLLATETGMYAGDAWLRAVADALAASVDDLGRMRAYLSLDASAQTAGPVSDAPGISFMMFSCFGGAQAFAELAERYDHQPLRDALVRFARYQLLPAEERRRHEPGDYVFSDALNTFRALDLLGYAYAITGDMTFADHFGRHAEFVCIELRDAAGPLYGVPDAGHRTVPVLRPWPDAPPDAERSWKRYYPLFPQSSAGQFFNMAVYLHKLQAIMLLAEAGG